MVFDLFFYVWNKNILYNNIHIYQCMSSLHKCLEKILSIPYLGKYYLFIVVENKKVYCKFMSDNCINYWAVYIFNRGLFVFVK